MLYSSSVQTVHVVSAAALTGLFVLILKEIAFSVGGSASMNAELIHSLAICGSLIFVFIALKMFPKRYENFDPPECSNDVCIISGFITCILFVIGGAWAIRSGIAHIQNPTPMNTLTIMGLSFPSSMVDMTILSVSVMLESYSIFRVYQHSIARYGRTKSPIQSLFVNTGPIMFMVAVEKATAIFGLSIAFFFTVLSTIFHTPALNGIASVLIGLMLFATGITIFLNMKSWCGHP